MKTLVLIAALCTTPALAAAEPARLLPVRQQAEAAAAALEARPAALLTVPRVDRPRRQREVARAGAALRLGAVGAAAAAVLVGGPVADGVLRYAAPAAFFTGAALAGGRE